MRSHIFVIIDSYAERYQLSAFPSTTENLPRQMQDKIEAKAASIHQRHNTEVCEQGIAVLQMLSTRALWVHYLRGMATTATRPLMLPSLRHFRSFQTSHVLKNPVWLLASLLPVMKLLLLAVGLVLLLPFRVAVPELLEH